MKEKQRLVGIDLCRGIAAYAVVLLHSGDQTWGLVESGVLELRNFFFFAVPFFLAASFYFAIRRFYVTGSTYPLVSRLQRILIPYVLWTVFYLFFKSLIFLIFNEHDKLNKLFQDPISIIFLGGASVQLYFLPLLLSGTLLLPLVEYLVKKQVKIKVLFLLFYLSIVINELVILSGNSFYLGSNIAFQSLVELITHDGNNNPFIRVTLVVIAWLLRCLPYICMAMILNYLFTKTGFKKIVNKYVLLYLAIFLGANTFGSLIFPISINDILRAYSLLLFAISLSTNLKENNIIANLGLCSFGIYLIHPFTINVIEVVISRIAPRFIAQVSVNSILVFSIPSFLMSWIIVSFMLKKKWLAKFMFSV